MKTEKWIILLSFVFGLVFWFVDGLLDFLFFYEQGFWDVVILRVPGHEIYIRSLGLVFFVTFGLVMARSVGRRGRAEEEVRNLAKFPSENPNPVLRISASGDILYRNEASAPLLGAWECSEGDRLGGDWGDVVADALEAGRNRQAELGCDGRTFSLTFTPVVESGYVNVYALDITERKRAEEDRRKLEAQIQHAQKLESLGVLAGGIAHDFNNLLLVVLGHADLALQDLSRVAPARESVDEIKKAAMRASELTGQLLAYSGKGQFVVTSIDLNEVIQEMGHLLQISISKKVVLRYDLEDSLPAIDADATQIRQILMNLITNASEAVGDKSGVVSITTGMVEATREYLQTVYMSGELAEGYYVFLEVSDTGCGMDEETQSKLFDPFFTTKFAGRGLGLAAVLGIVRGHRGAIKVYSEPGEGTTFKVLLPCGEQPAPPVGVEGVEPAEAWKGSATVLVVDDEETVRNIAKRMLEKIGFTVLTAADGREAVEVFGEHPDEIATVLLDMTMPHLNGEETFRELRRIRPEVRVILSSGYNEQEATNRFTGKGLAGFIQKPYEYSKLVAEFRGVLGEEWGA